MKKNFLSLICISFLLSSRAQITKDNWLWGGNISFSNTKDRNDFGPQLNESQIQISGNVGYFFIDKLSAGLRPNYFFTRTKTDVNTLNENNLSIGPFLRYYFLPNEGRVNFFADAGYSYGGDKVTGHKNVSSNTFYFSTGPALFLNSSVAIELSIGYSSTRANDDTHYKRNIIQSGIGLQFYLEKE